jgi:hypothetical protein
VGRDHDRAAGRCRCTIPLKADQVRHRKNKGSREADYEAIVQIAAINDWLTCLCDTP